MDHTRLFLFAALACILGAAACRLAVFWGEHGDNPALLERAVRAQYTADLLCLAVLPLAALGGHPGLGVMFFLAGVTDGSSANRNRRRAKQLRQRQEEDARHLAAATDRRAAELGLPPTPRITDPPAQPAPTPREDTRHA